MIRSTVVKITVSQRRELEAIIARRTEAAGLVRRARVILLSAAEVSGQEIALRLDLSAEAVSRIRTRFRRDGVLVAASRCRRAPLGRDHTA
jgi:hypothetical protein